MYTIYNIKYNLLHTGRVTRTLLYSCMCFIRLPEARKRDIQTTLSPFPVPLQQTNSLGPVHKYKVQK